LITFSGPSLFIKREAKNRVLSKTRRSARADGKKQAKANGAGYKQLPAQRRPKGKTEKEAQKKPQKQAQAAETGTRSNTDRKGWGLRAGNEISTNRGLRMKPLGTHYAERPRDDKL
jgi:hypothetical protein